MPIPLSGFFDLFGVRDVTFWPPPRQEVSREAGGRAQVKDMGSPLWRASFTTAPQSLRAAQAFEAALMSLNGSAGTFLAFDPRRPFPAAYPAGLFADTARIGTLFDGNAFLIALSHLTPGFTLSPGDYLSFSYGSRPSRALHLITGVDSGSLIAGAGGETGALRVFPPLRPGALVGASVTLKRPACEMRLDGGQAPPSLVDMAATSVSFSATQAF